MMAIYQPHLILLLIDFRKSKFLIQITENRYHFLQHFINLLPSFYLYGLQAEARVCKLLVIPVK